MKILNKFLKKILPEKDSLVSDPFYKRYNVVLGKAITENSLAISLKNHYMYCRIYKSANSSVVSSLYNAETGISIYGVKDIQDIKDNYFTKPSELTNKQLEDLSSFTKFTFVRNPYSRIWSAYLDKILPIDRPQRKYVISYLNKSASEEISFDEFLFYLENGGLRNNGHWAPQRDFLVFPISDYHMIGKVESLQSDLKSTLRGIFKKDCELISVNDHKTGAVEVSEGMNSKYKSRIYKLYEGDFESFHYEQ